MARVRPPNVVGKRLHDDEDSVASCSNNQLVAESSHLPTPKRARVGETTKQFSVQPAQSDAFYQLLEDEVIRQFLAQDKCFRMSDKYLLAMVLAYFRKAHLPLEKYTRENFFIALFLANNVEEDEPFYTEILLWVLGRERQKWKRRLVRFKSRRDRFWAKMGYHSLVSRSTCERIMADNTNHWAWKRTRKPHHGWAIRCHARSIEEYIISGPDGSLPTCMLCANSNKEQRS